MIMQIDFKRFTQCIQGDSFKVQEHSTQCPIPKKVNDGENSSGK